MKIGDAAKIYSAQLKDFWEQKRTLAKQKKDLEEKMKASPEAKDKFANMSNADYDDSAYDFSLLPSETGGNGS